MREQPFFINIIIDIFLLIGFAPPPPPPPSPLGGIIINRELATRLLDKCTVIIKMNSCWMRFRELRGRS